MSQEREDLIKDDLEGEFESDVESATSYQSSAEEVEEDQKKRGLSEERRQKEGSLTSYELYHLLMQRLIADKFKVTRIASVSVGKEGVKEITEESELATKLSTMEDYSIRGVKRDEVLLLQKSAETIGVMYPVVDTDKISEEKAFIVLTLAEQLANFKAQFPSSPPPTRLFVPIAEHRNKRIGGPRDHWTFLEIDFEKNTATFNDPKSPTISKLFYSTSHIRDAVKAQWPDMEYTEKYAKKQGVFDEVNCGRYVSRMIDLRANNQDVKHCPEKLSDQHKKRDFNLINKKVDYDRAVSVMEERTIDFKVVIAELEKYPKENKRSQTADLLKDVPQEKMLPVLYRYYIAIKDDSSKMKKCLENALAVLLNCQDELEEKREERKEAHREYADPVKEFFITKMKAVMPEKQFGTASSISGNEKILQQLLEYVADREPRLTKNEKALEIARQQIKNILENPKTQISIKSEEKKHLQRSQLREILQLDASASTTGDAPESVPPVPQVRG
jgi:hypothetical protein